MRPLVIVYYIIPILVAAIPLNVCVIPQGYAYNVHTCIYMYMYIVYAYMDEGSKIASLIPCYSARQYGLDRA